MLANQRWNVYFRASMGDEEKEKRIAVTIWLTPSIRREMKHEGVDRNMSMGDLVEEAWRSRPKLIVREGLIREGVVIK